MPPQQEFKIRFSIDLNNFSAGLKSALTMTQAAGKQIQPLLNLQMAAPDFSPFEKELIRLQEEMSTYSAAQEAAQTTSTGLDAAQEQTSQSAVGLGAAEGKAATETERLGNEQRRTKFSTDLMSDSFQRAFFTISTLQNVSSILRNTYGGLIDAANQQERAEAAYAHALQNRGLLTSTSIQDVRTYASEIQNLTGIQDEEVVSAMSRLTAMGLEGDALKQATMLAADFAIFMQNIDGGAVSLSTAVRLMADAFDGNIGMLSRYIKTLDEADIKQRGAISIIEQLTERIGGQATAFGQTAAGQMRIHAAAVDDSKEVLGGLVREALIPFLSATRPYLDFFTTAPRLMQVVIGGTALLTTTLAVLQVSGIAGIIQKGFILVKTTLPQMVAGFTAATTAAYGTAGALATVQVAGLGLIASLTLIAGFIGFNQWLQSQQQQLEQSAEAIRKAREEIEEYRKAVDDLSRSELERERAAIQVRAANQGDLTEEDRRRMTVIDERLKRLTLEEEKHRKLLASSNVLIKARTELESAKKELDAQGLTETDVKRITRKIQLKEEEVKRLENLGRIDLEQEKKFTETKARLQEEHAKAVAEIHKQVEIRRLDVIEKTELLEAEKEFKRTGNEEQFEITKLAIAERYAIKRIDLQEAETIRSLEIEKARLKALNTPESRLQIELIERQIEEVKKKAIEDRSFTRQETNVKVTQIQISTAPAGSIDAQQKKISDLTKKWREADTDSARRAAQAQLKIEQEKYDRMTMSAKDFNDRELRLQEERRRNWIESHRVIMAGIDGITSGVGTLWTRFLGSERQAKDEWDASWLSMRNTAVNAIGRIVEEEVESFLVRLIQQRIFGAEKTAAIAAEGTIQTGVMAAQAGAQTGIASAAIGIITTATVASMAAITAAASTAATLVSIATFGGAAGVGEAAVLQALATVKAASIIPIPGFEKGGRIEKGSVGFFEGRRAEIVVPEEDFYAIARAEMIPAMMKATYEFNMNQTRERVSQRVAERSQDSAEQLKQLRSIQRAIEDLELRNKVVIEENEFYRVKIEKIISKYNDREKEKSA